MDPEVQYCIHKDTPIIPILRRINPIPRIDTYFFKIHSNIVLPSTPWPFLTSLSWSGVPVKMLKALLPSSIPAHLSLLGLIVMTILGERYAIVYIYSKWHLDQVRHSQNYKIK